MSFGKLHIPVFPGQMYPNARKILSAAKLNNLTLDMPEFKFQETNKTPEYLAKFPLGKVPAFESPSGDFCLWESDAIANYISSAGPAKSQLLGTTAQEAAKVQQWIMFCSCHLSPAVMGLAIWRFGFGEFDAVKEEAHMTELVKWMDHVEDQLKGKSWLAGGEKQSLADYTVAGVIYVGLVTSMDKAFMAKYPETLRWMAAVQALEETKELYAGEWIETKKVGGE